jgi:hypothetical protein
VAHELPVTLGTVLGVGKSAAGTLYLADEVASTSTDRVFVSSGGSLFRKRVIGSGSSGGGADADYTLSFEEGLDAATARALVIQRRGGKVTAMGLGPGGKAFIGMPGATDEPLTVLDVSAISSMKLRNLPGEVAVEYVADVENGSVLVVTRPMDDWTYTDFRLFYGKAGQMAERAVTQVTRSRSGSTDIQFLVDGAPFVAHFAYEFGVSDGGAFGHPGPGTLDTGAGKTLAFEQRTPTPARPTGFSFVCIH